MLRGTDEQELADAVVKFPDVFDQAVDDWAKFKIGVAKGLFTLSEQQDIIEWFKKLPELWAMIRPNFVLTRIEGKGAYLPLTPPEFANTVDKWIEDQNGFTLAGVNVQSGLGIAPLVVAGIILAGVLAIGGALWVVGYIKKQQNISRLIDEVTAGHIPASVLQEAIKQDVRTPLTPIGETIGQFSDLVKWLAIGLAGYYVIPMLGEWLRGRQTAAE